MLNKISSLVFSTILLVSILQLFSGSDMIPDRSLSENISHREFHNDANAGSHAFENCAKASSGDKYAPIYILLFVLIIGAVLGRYVAKKLGQPPVLGELVAGVLISIILFQMNSPIMTLIRHQDEVNNVIESNLENNISWSEAVRNSFLNDSTEVTNHQKDMIEIMESPEFPSYKMTIDAIFLLSSLGVLILLFAVGLESNFEDMVKVGVPALVTAVIGVIVPSILGYFTAKLLLPGHDPNFYLFIGAALSATSIGITARVFKDMGKLHIKEAKIVLGAAVIDDILGLIILAVVAGIISSGSVEIATVGIILLKAVLFLGITLFIGTKFLRQQIKVAAIIDNKNIRLLFPFALLMLLAYLSDLIGLASIVGAFAAGLIIKEEYFNDALMDKKSSVMEVIQPIEAIFAPVFFVIMGLQVDLSAFLNFNILGVALALTAVAIAGKLISGIFAKGMDKKIIGIGMVPRGEVGLIFASIGKVLGVLDGALFSAVIIIVILTTFITPPALKWSFEKYDQKLADKNQ
ncbi:MAG TPA: cation:proton antiporter [Ignavibacteria bacterium]|nr:cation:proton antiporter [Ignavibacteria bacterium]HMR41574.1 cation:proton antiporter [Ignavibacteria bacterium]